MGILEAARMLNMEDGRREARREERAKTKAAIANAEREIAAKLKLKGMSLVEIAELTGLSIEEIQAL